MKKKNTVGQLLILSRGDHIVPSFDELFPGQRGDEDLNTTRKKHIGDEYYRDAMEVTYITH